MILSNKLPQKMIDDARWLYSLPVGRITPYTSRIYRAVAEMQALRKLRRRPTKQMKALGEILIEAAGTPSVLDEIFRAHNTLETIPRVSKGQTIRDLIDILAQPVAGIRNKSKRGVTVQFIDAVDLLQKRGGCTPKRKAVIEFINLPAFDDGECTRQVKRLGWGEWI